MQNKQDNEKRILGFTSKQILVIILLLVVAVAGTYAFLANGGQTVPTSNYTPVVKDKKVIKLTTGDNDDLKKSFVKELGAITVKSNGVEQHLLPMQAKIVSIDSDNLLTAEISYVSYKGEKSENYNTIPTENILYFQQFSTKLKFEDNKFTPLFQNDYYGALLNCITYGNYLYEHKVNTNAKELISTSKNPISMAKNINSNNIYEVVYGSGFYKTLKITTTLLPVDNVYQLEIKEVPKQK